MAKKRIDVLVDDPALLETYSRLGVSDAYDGRDRLVPEELQLASDPETLAADVRLASTLIPLKALTEHHLTELIRISHMEMIFAGQRLFEAGSYDGDHIFLLHGDLRLETDGGDHQILRGSSCLGPIAHRQPRPCHGVAVTDCSILRVNSAHLDKMLTWSQVAEYMLLDIAYQRDLDEDAEWMMTILKSNLFHKVPPINLPSVLDRLQVLVVEAGDAVLRQGERGDKCYFIKQGVAEVRRSPDGFTPPQTIAEVGPGRCFGEDALVNETVRNASIIMKTDGVLMYFSKQDFLKLLKEPQVRTLDALSAGVLLEESGAVAIDVRTHEEYAEERLERAINIPLYLLRIKIRLLNRETPYLLYCDTGRRSRAAAHLLSRAGFNVAALEDGLRGLESSLQPTSLRLNRGSSRSEYILKDGKVVESTG